MINETSNIPDTPIIREAITIVKAAVSDNIFHHSMRTYYLGILYAEKEKLKIEKEELLLSALFHDTGFFSPYPKNFFFLEFNNCLFKSLSSIPSLVGLFFPEKYFGSNHYIS